MTTEHSRQFAHPEEWQRRFQQGQLHDRELVIPGPHVQTEFIDEEGYSDDDELPNDNELLKAARRENIAAPKSLKFLRVATTGSFNCQVASEIQARGGEVVNRVDASVHLLIAPHRLPRSSKAANARKLGIPIIDEATLLGLPMAVSTMHW